MQFARWLIVIVASVTSIGGLLADYFLASGRQHIRNPQWPPHAKFHGGQTVLLGLCTGILSIVLLFQESTLTHKTIVISAVIASLYWLCIFAAPIFPGTAFVDPEFVQPGANARRIPAQLIWGLVLVGLLVIAVAISFVGA